jgi:hypothetical protein
MKSLAIFAICAATLAAQPGSLSKPLGNVPTVGALGGPFLAPAKPLGGIATSNKKPVKSTGYVGPVYYIPNAFGSSFPYVDSSSSVYPDATPASTSYSAQPNGQPIVINQYFVTKGSSIPGQPEPAAAPEPDQPVVNPGDPLTPPASYYLIAYKDHSVYSALAYWVEGDTLHYVTTQNTHNQASLSLIDVDQSYKLNSDRSVPFSIPGK